jgi:hypothetical protein
VNGLLSQTYFQIFVEYQRTSAHTRTTQRLHDPFGRNMRQPIAQALQARGESFGDVALAELSPFVAAISNCAIASFAQQ